MVSRKTWASFCALAMWVNSIGAAEIRLPAMIQGNADTPERVSLGHKLFFDRRMSINRERACVDCHKPELGFSDGLQVSTGIRGQQTTRNSPTIIDAGFKFNQFHDKRADSLEAQALQPLQSAIEMGAQTPDQVANRLNRIPGYRAEFQRVFGQQATPANMGLAIAAFERTIISTNAPIDRAVKWTAGREPGKWVYEITPEADWALSRSARRGLDLFFGRGNCAACHHGPSYTHDNVANNGMGFYQGFTNDDGRQGISNRDSDRRAFAVPTLREVVRTAPYGHAGQFPTLASVVQHYSRPPADRLRDVRVQPSNFTAQEAADLTTLLTEGFVGQNYPAIAPPTLPDDPPGGLAIETDNNNQGRRRGILRRR